MSSKKNNGEKSSPEETFASLLSFNLADIAARLGDTVICCNEMAVAGHRHQAVVRDALEVVSRLSRLHGEALPTTCTVAEPAPSDAVQIFLIFMQAFFQAPTQRMSFSAMLATKTFCPLRWQCGQHPVTWLALKAIFSIDEKEAESAAAAIVHHLPNRLAEVAFLAFMFKTQFSVQLLRARIEGSRPFLEAFYQAKFLNLLTGVEFLNMLTYDVTESEFADLFNDTRGIEFLKRAEFAMARSKQFNAFRLSCQERRPPPTTDWDILHKHVLNIIEMGYVIIRSRQMWPTIILWVNSDQGFRCFARRLWYKMQDFPHWSKHCAADICSCVKAGFDAQGLRLSHPTTKEERQLAETFDKSTRRWTTPCLDDESRRRLDEITARVQATGHPPIPAQSQYTSFAVVAFAIIPRENR